MSIENMPMTLSDDKKLTLTLNNHLPHSLELEKSVLASLITIPDSFDKVSNIIVKEDFYANRHQLIFDAIVHLSTVNEPYDVMMVVNWLEMQKLLDAAGGIQYLSDVLSQNPATMFNLTAYAQKVKDFATLRQIIKVGNNLLEAAFNPKAKTVSDLLEMAESEIFAINEQHNNRAKQKGPRKITRVLTDVIEMVNDLSHSQSGLIGLQTPFVELNNKTQGLQKGDLIIIAARPSMGKTTLAMNLVESILIQENLPVVVFSLEMPATSISMRLLSSLGAINQSHLRSGQMNEDEWGRLTYAIQHLSDKKLYVDDSTDLPPSELRSRCRRIAKEHGGQLGLVMVDYLQLLKVPSLHGNRVAEISEISRNLKALAREMNCPVVALSQLNRSLENRPNKRPQMSDLRESGAIEQDADLIMFIYRDEVYNDKSEFKGQAEIIIGKQRNGPIGTIRLKFDGMFTRFRDLTPEDLMNTSAFSEHDE